MIDIEKIRAETPGIEFSTHLLACGSSLMPKNVVDAITQHTQLEALMGGYEAEAKKADELNNIYNICLLYTSPSPRDKRQTRMPSSA